MDQEKKEQLAELFDECVSDYLLAEQGQGHMRAFPAVREQGRRNFDEVLVAKERGEDITDLVLLKLLPYTDSKKHREQGAWIHVAPAIMGDIRNWFGSVGWQKEEDWPDVSLALFDFVQECKNNPELLSDACKRLYDLPYTKGFQTGIVTPILNALRPSDYLIVNNKTRATINYFTDHKYKQRITDYAQTNSEGRRFVNEYIKPIKNRYPRLSAVLDEDVFDIFCHWLVGVKKFELKPGRKTRTQRTRYWKVAPGSGARFWESCLDNGYISVGWDELGDLSEVDRKEYERRRDALLKKHPNWTVESVEQVWRFAHIQEGDRIVANRGTSEVLGIGTVIGPYEFIPEIEHGHRLPVQWDDISVRQINEGGWRRTLIELDEKKFNSILEASGVYRGIDSETALPRYWIEKTIVKGRPDREGGDHEMGKALWSPQKSTDGKDIYKYMREVGPGDIVLHLTDNQAITGVSVVASDMDDSFVGVSGTEWSERPAYRIQLKEFVPLEPPLHREKFLGNPRFRDRLTDIAKKGQHNLFYAKSLELNQGAYLTPAPPELIGLLNSAYREMAGKDLPYVRVGTGEPVTAYTRQPSYTVSDFAEECGFKEEQIEDWLTRLRRKKHVVLQGPPGTGKTYVAERLARVVISGTQGMSDIVQFHPSYAYEDFMQGIRPEVVNGQLTFELTPGRFLQFCKEARERGNDAPCVLIIDEINRANLSKVFGELMYLLEYRDAQIPLSSGGDTFQVPQNVFIIGTMNTADRSIALVDHALRRRFSFISLGPDYEVLRKHLERHGLPAESLIQTLREVNAAIDDPHYEVGISFFLADGERLRETLPIVWTSEIEPYLEEYFYDQPDKLDALRWESLVATTLADWQ